MPGPNPFAPRTYGELEKLTERVYIFRNITNSSFVIGSRGVAVIDTQVNHPGAKRLLSLVRTVTDKPVTHVINTHYHWDHTNGNEIFKAAGATVVSSSLTRTFMQTRSDRQKAFLQSRGFQLGRDPYLPDQVFDGEHSLDLGDQPLKLFFAGSAESDDATAVWVEREKVLISGDTIMTGSFPIFGQPVWDEGLQDGQWKATIGNLLAHKPQYIIPGHGPLATEASVELLVRIQDYFLTEVKHRVDRGLTLNAVLEDMETRMPDWLASIPVVWGNPRYAILRVWRALTRKPQDTEPGWQRFKPSAIPAADENQVRQKTSGLNSAEDYSAMAHELREGGDEVLSLTVLREAVSRYPAHPDLQAAYAEALIGLSRREASVLEKGDFFDEAQKAWNRALEHQPEHAASILGKGRYLVMMAYRGGEDPSEGMELLQRLVNTSKIQDSMRGEASFYLGMGYRRLGDESEARLNFVRARQLNPGFMPAHRAMSA